MCQKRTHAVQQKRIVILSPRRRGRAERRRDKGAGWEIKYPSQCTGTKATPARWHSTSPKGKAMISVRERAPSALRFHGELHHSARSTRPWNGVWTCARDRGDLWASISHGYGWKRRRPVSNETCCTSR